MLLEAEGLLVVGEAADGQSALHETEVLQPDVVLLDVGLPDLDGFEIATRLASHRPVGTGDRPDLEPRRRDLWGADRGQSRSRVPAQGRPLGGGHPGAGPDRQIRAGRG